MAMSARPSIMVSHNQTVYCSLDAVDQTFFDGLNSATHRRKFCEMIYRWHGEIQTHPETAPTNGQAIVAKWRSSGCRIRNLTNLRTMPVTAVRAMPPQTVQVGQPVAAPRAVSTLPTPLAELTPRFLCQSDESNDIQLSPTKGLANFVAAELDEPWRFADVIFQREPLTHNDRVPLAPPTSVYLYVCPSGDGRIEKQIAVKCQEVYELAKSTHDSTLETADAAVQHEINMHQLVGSTNCSHVTKYRGYSVRTINNHLIKPNDDDQTRVGVYPQKTVLLYQDFAGCGNLEQLINRHREAKRPISEHFIWYTLRELTEALIALNRGPGHCSNPHRPAAALPSSDEYQPIPVGSWVPILHLDIKTDNVFLETNNTDYPAYPKPVLADFGVSRQGTESVIDLRHSDGSVQQIPRFAGTNGWQPPERHDGALKNLADEGDAVDLDYAPYRWQLSEKSDIWALGLIAHRMMYSHRADEEAYDGDSESIVAVDDLTLSKEGTWKVDLRNREIKAHESHFDVSKADIAHLPDRYSVRLCVLASHCLRHNLEARPDLDELLEICRRELTRLDNLSGSTAGKRKRDDSDEDTALLFSDDQWDQKVTRYRVGEIYQRKRLRTKVDLENLDRDRYSALVSTWSSMARPSTASQAVVISEIDSHLRGYQDGHAMIDASNASDSDFKTYDWAVKHLISCLRKRNSPRHGAYILTANYVEENNGSEWIEQVFDIAIKAKILEHLLNLDAFWHDRHREHNGGEEEDGIQGAFEALRNAVDWGLMLLSDTLATASRDTQGTTTTGGDPAEPREPQLEEKSALHEGIYDWIFVKPTGAFYKN